MTHIANRPEPKYLDGLYHVEIVAYGWTIVDEYGEPVRECGGPLHFLKEEWAIKKCEKMNQA